MVEAQTVAMGGAKDNKQKYAVLFSKKAFAVPQSDVLLLPQKSNPIATAEALGALLSTKAPDKWKPYCQHGTVALLQGHEGTAPYTTFEVPGFSDEWRFLRPISKVVADKIFPDMLEEVLKELKEKKIPKPTNDRQQARIDVYKWNSSENLKDKNQLSPEVNKWPEITSHEEALRSCSIAPQSQKRKKGGGAEKGEREGEQAKVSKYAKGGQVVVDVGPKGSYAIVEQPGFVHIIRYEAAAEAEDGNNSNDADI